MAACVEPVKIDVRSNRGTGAGLVTPDKVAADNPPSDLDLNTTTSRATPGASTMTVTSSRNMYDRMALIALEPEVDKRMEGAGEKPTKAPDTNRRDQHLRQQQGFALQQETKLP